MSNLLTAAVSIASFGYLPYLDHAGYQNLYQLSAAAAMETFDCKKPLKGQVLGPFHVDATRYSWDSEVNGTVTLIDAKRLDKDTPPQDQDRLEKFPIRLTGRTSDGTITYADTYWRPGSCPSFAP